MARWRRWSGLLGVLWVLILVGGIGSAESAAAAGIQTITLSPSTISLPVDYSASGAVVVANPGTAARVVKVSTIASDPTLTVKLDNNPASSPQTITVGPGGSQVLTYTVLRTAEGPGGDSSVEFVSSSGTGAAKAESIALLTVKYVASPVLVKADLHSKIDTLNENEPGQAQLVVSNPGDDPIDITGVIATTPDQVDVTINCPGAAQVKLDGDVSKPSKVAGCHFTVAGQSSVVVPLDLKPQDALAPGHRSLIISVSARRPDTSLTATATASLDFDVDIFAQSDILKALGVPAFLLLPGVITLVCAWYLVKKASQWRVAFASTTIDFSFEKASGYAVASVGLSLAIAKIYPWLTENFVPGTRRDYLVGEGFQDFYYVYVYAFIAALFLWILVLSAGVLRSLLRWLFLFGFRDDPADVIRKARNRGVFGKSMYYSQVLVNGGQRLVLSRRRDGKALLASPVLIAVSGPDKAALEARLQSYIDGNSSWALGWRIGRSLKTDEVSLTFAGGTRLAAGAPGDAAGTEVPLAKVYEGS